MLLCLAKANDVRLIASLRVGHVHDDAIEPAEQIGPLFAIRYAGIFPGDDRPIEDRFAAHKIELVVSDVANSLRFIPVGILLL